MSEQTTTPDQENEQGGNRYNLVNHVAKRAKVILSHDTSQLTNHRAINQAMQQIDEDDDTKS